MTVLKAGEFKKIHLTEIVDLHAYISPKYTGIAMRLFRETHRNRQGYTIQPVY